MIVFIQKNISLSTDQRKIHSLIIKIDLPSLLGENQFIHGEIPSIGEGIDEKCLEANIWQKGCGDNCDCSKIPKKEQIMTFKITCEKCSDEKKIDYWATPIWVKAFCPNFV